MVKTTAKKSVAETAESEKKLPVMNPLEDIITAEDKKEFHRLDEIICGSMDSISKSGYAVAFAIHTIYAKNLYRVDGYKNVYSYALERYGLSRTTCNDFINMVDRFGKISGNDKECITEIVPEYELYGNSQLLAMKGYTDAEIADAKINPSMSVRDIKKALKGERDDSAKVENDSKESRKSKEEEETDSRCFNLVAEVTHSIGLQNEDIIAVIDKLLLMGHRIYICDVSPEHFKEFESCNFIPVDMPSACEDVPETTAPEKSPAESKTA